MNELDSSPEMECESLLNIWNQTAAIYPTDHCLHQLFEKQVTKSRDAIAVECNGETLSYRALNSQSNRLAHYLILQGVRPDTLVGICMGRSTKLVVAILGILKAGGAYVPLDPAYPSQRLTHILQDANPLCLVADSTGREVFAEHVVTLVDIEQVLSSNISDDNIVSSKLGLSPHHLAYVIYTSGSTGLPKGVMIEHRSIVNYAKALASLSHVVSESRILQFASCSFDASVSEIVMALTNGARLCIPTEEDRETDISLLDYISSSQVTHALLPPALLQNTQNLAELQNLKALFLGGETPSISLLKNAATRTAVYNLYGPTEATIMATFWQCPVNFVGSSISIGRPVANTLIYVLDSEGEPVPIGKEGELYVGGAGVARGYLNRPELTLECFLPDPFSEQPGARMYRTGDRACYLTDGNLVYLGRIDHQVKIRGYRIEPGEIEACLVEHPRVHEAVVVPRNDGSDTRLVAYVVAEPDVSLARVLRTYLASLLPDYMIPVAYVCLTALPITPNGKLDRRSLPAPDDDAFASQVYEAPQGEMEEKLAGIWRELLGIDRISRHDNFFELGGHSLLVVRLLAQLRKDELETSVRAVFETPTLAALAGSINRRLQNIITPPNLITINTTKITPEMLPLISLSQKEIDLVVSKVPGGVTNVQDIYALTPLQHGILVHHMMAERGDPYLIITRLKFTERIALDRYASALQQVIERHDVLRTAFVWEDLNEPAQIVWRRVSSLLTEISLDEKDGSILEQLENRFTLDHYKLDLKQASLLRLIVSPESDGSWVALQLMHHIIGDNVTSEKLIGEVHTIAESRRRHLPTPTQFRHVVAQSRLKDDSDAHIRFFTEMLADVDSPTLPFGLIDVRRNGTEVGEAHLKLPQALVVKLRAQASSFRVSLASLCHLAWARVLACASSCEKVVFGTVVLGRFQVGEGGDSAVGLLINTLPLRLNMDDTTVGVAVCQTHSRLSALLSHEHASLAMVQRCSGIPADMPLFSALLNYRHLQRNDKIETSIAGMSILGSESRTNYPLILSIDDDDDGLHLTAQVSSSASATRICAYMQQALISMADALQDTPKKPVRSLTVLPTEERHMLLHGWNQTAVTYPTDRCLHQLFEAQVKKNCSAIAVECGGETLSYGALNSRANRLAHYLIQKGVRPDSLVGLCMKRSTQMVVGILGILKAGGAYVPLDPAYPSQRLFQILQDANPLCFVVDSIGRELLGQHKVLLIDIEQALSTNMSEENIDCSELGLTSSNLTYVIYTSGSTGTPKGVMVEHQQVVRLFESTREKFDFNVRDKWCLAHSYSFDFSVWEVWGAFYNGCQLSIVPVKTSLSILEFYEWICSNGITVLNQTSSAFKMLLEAKNISSTPDHLRYVIFGGEEYDHVISKIWDQKYAGSPTNLINMYGITETTVHVTFQRLKSLEDAYSIGRPLSGLNVYILDSQGEPVPLGAEGELYIGGSGLTRGYLNRTELTSQRFLTDPFCNRPGDRMYRTGDRARYLPDGKLVYLGRCDQQVKIRGHRIEPGEIEARLVDHPSVREAVVVPRSDGSDTRLVAYVVAAPDTSLASDLRAYLSSLLPDYMIPVAYVCLTALPITPNGKLDRRSLPAPDDGAFASQVYEAPQGQMEEKLAGIWRDLLGIDRISRHDNFFELGGHSLLVVRLLAQLRKDELETSVRAVFEAPTLAALAGSINRRLQNFITPPNLISTNTTKITPEMLPLISLSQKEIDLVVVQVPGGVTNVQDIYALTPLQHGILVHHMMAERGDPYLNVTSLHFTDRVALDRYASALQQVIERHDVLRTAFVWDGLSEPAQIVWRQVPSLLTEIMFDEYYGPVLEQLTKRFSLDHYKVDLTQASLLRLIASPISDGSWVALQLMHHIFCDNTTSERLIEEVHAIAQVGHRHLPTPTQFRHVVAQSRLKDDSDAHIRFFTEMLADVDSPTLPFGLIDVRRNGTEVGEAHLKLPQALVVKLRAQASSFRVSLASLCHLAWARVLACASSCEKVVFGTVVLGRFQVGEGGDSAVGLLINTLPLRLNMDDTTVGVAVCQTHSRLSALLSHEHASLAMVQRCSGIPADMPLFSALLNYRHLQRNDKIETSIAGMSILGSESRTNYPLILSIDDDDDGLHLTAQVSSSASATRICAYMQQALISMADALQDTPKKPVRSLTVLPTEERHMLLHGWNQTAVTYPTDRCLHQSFEAQVKKNCSAIAVECGGETLSYGALNSRANRLAHYLIQKGVRPDSLVGLCMKRSTQMVVGILSILKAGGAYVPLDPAYPSQRLSAVLQDANPLCLIADSTGKEVLGEHDVPLVHMEQAFSENLSDDNIDTSELGLTPSHLAYVIHTSGSTGKPKGVMVEHRNVTNFLNWTKDAFTIEDLDHTFFSTSVSFDTSVFELFAPLSVGGMIHVVADAMILTSTHSNISLLNTVPSAVTALLNANAIPMSLNAINLAGEALNSRLINRVFANCHISQLSNLYGPTETTIYSTWHKYKPDDAVFETIGRPVANTRIYLLDSQGEPVPFGVEGELYIGGAGVTRGYLNRPELTAERFPSDPFNDQPGARMYRTGDRACYLPDGNLVYLGRSDHQVKIRGYRIELGEIEARLVEHPRVHEAVVVPRSDGSDTRLVAYVVAQPDTSLARDLRKYLALLLPDYMVPATYVCLTALPITPNGKLDRRSLPAPDDDAFASQVYEAPQGQMEEKLASIWRDLLGIDRISRRDNFFELGGHSLLVVRLLAQLRKDELETSVRAVFETPTLAALAGSINRRLQNIITPPNLITINTTKITPEMLPLISLSQKEIDLVVSKVPGGVTNVQDIYALTPLQHGILVHHMMAERGDPYLIITRLKFTERIALDRYASALQQVIERHDVLRTAFVWEDLNEPAQIVWRRVSSLLTEISLDEKDGSILEQLENRFTLDHYKLDLKQASLLRLIVSPEFDGSWVALQLMHHIIGDNVTLQKLKAELNTIAKGESELLATPIPFRNVVAQARQVSHSDAHIEFFKEILGDVDSPTLPFGLTDILDGGTEVSEAYLKLPQALTDELKAHARRLRISLASLCHLAWARVLACTSMCEKVVFGTVLLGRFQAGEGDDSAMGLLINTLPLRLNIDETSVEAAAFQTHTRLSALLTHEHTSLAMTQRCSSIPADMPLFSALLNYRHIQKIEGIDISFPGMTILGSEGRTNYPITLSIDDDQNDYSLSITAQVSSPVSAIRICAYMQQTLVSMADALKRTPQKPVRSLTVVPPEERDMLLHGWNQTESNYPADLCLHQLFEKEVTEYGNLIAVECEGETLTYAALNTRANRLAHYLIKQGVRPDTLVGLCMGRSTALVVAILGILKAGGAYVPLDPNYSSQRLIHILEDADPLCLLVDSAGEKALGSHKVPLVDVDNALSSNISDHNPDPAQLKLSLNHLAYVIYTSGSTGTPKGAMIEHRSVVNYARAISSLFHFETESRVLQFASCSFDASLSEIVMAWNKGARLCIPTEEDRRSDIAILDYMISQDITHAFLPPAIFRHTQDLTVLRNLKALILVGETPPISLLQSAVALTSVFNGYGPTETTMGTNVWQCPADFDSHSIPIGRPIANARVYLLDSQGEPVPLGAEGELYIGGAGIARGYLKRPELTAERFLPDPFSDSVGSRMYRTGDLARYRSDGNVIYLGRCDQQVKVRGYRIEPGEIAARLVEHPRVLEAVVVPRGDGSDTRLIAYVVAEPDTSLARVLRTYLASLLPDYMIPVAYVCLTALPITPNGKFDRRSLPAPDDDAFASQVYEAPQGEMEEKLAGIWRELLGIDRISRHDNFFELGGHSLLVVRLLAQLRKGELETSVRAVFETPTLAALAGSINRSLQNIITPPNLITINTTKITPDKLPLISLFQKEIDFIVSNVPGGVTNVQDIYALTPLQHGILFHHMMAERGDPYLIITRLKFTERIALDRYASALQQVVERHDVLRTAFVWESLNEPAQIVWRRVSSLLTEISLDEKDGSILEQLENRFTLDHYKLDLKQASLLRLIVSPESDGSWVALQLMHHIIGDNVTSERLIEEVRTIAKGESELLATPIPFRNVVAQARQVSHSDAHIEFFKEMLGDVDSPTLPFGLTDILDGGTEVSEAYLKLPQVLTNELKAHARRLQISLASLCHLAWGQVLACTSMCEKVVFGTVLLGRFQAGEGDDSAVGLLINTLPLRLNIDDIPVEAAACQTHTRLSALLTHEHTSLAMTQRCSGIPADMPLFSALLNYRHIQKIEGIDISFPGMTILSREGRTNYPITLSIDDDQNDYSLSITAQVVSPVSAIRICAYMQQTLVSMADALKRTPQKPVRSLTVLPPEERDMLLHGWNQTESNYPADLCLHQLFEKEVTKYGNAIAVECEGETLTYAALNTRANRLAHYLIKQGVRPDTLVGLCMGRSTALVVAILGILKAGGAYVPLDPNYSSQRLIHILEDADPLCLLVDSAGEKALGSHKVPLVDVDNALSSNISDHNPDPAQLKLSLNRLAYVIYTSGSTGTPKGAMIEHRSVVNYARAISSLFHVDSESRVLQFASCSFDASVSEIVMALTKGARLSIPTEEDRRSDIAILDYMTSQNITHAFLPPAIFRHTQDLTVLRNLKALILVGETPPISLLQSAVALTAVFNGYGPTETTIVTNFWQCPADFNSHSIPIGRPIANARVYLLDSQGEPVPLGAEGELYIGGAGIARGYLKRPELTAERFLPDPFSDSVGSRMYRTGDLARYRSDGNVIYLGRCDQQVKIRGYRIEPGEIAARLVEHPRVHEAVVVPRGDGSDTRLIAYVVAEPDMSSLARVLRTYLASLLPDYMIPVAYVCLPNLPLTRNGKLDQRALPSPDDEAFASQSYEAPQGEIEEKLTVIWREVLGIERISRHDNFFELGGHSLLAMKLANHVELHNIHIDTRGIYSFPILKDLAKQISRNFSKSFSDAAIPVRRSGDQPPIFCVPDGTGDTGYAFELSNVIDKKYPVYVLPWLSPEKPQPLTIEELANAMIPLIKRVRSNGPCAIIGYSAGGLLAYELTKQLMKGRYSVAFLGLLDTYPPNTTYLADTDLFWMSLALKSSSIRTPDKQWWERVKSLKLNEAIEEAKGVIKDIKNVDIESESLVSKQSHHFLSMCAAYKVQSIPLKVHLFKAKFNIVPYKDNEYVYSHVENSIPDDLRSNREDPILGWGKCSLTTDFQVISVDGNHMSMTTDPNNRTSLGKEITHSLNASIRVTDKN